MSGRNEQNSKAELIDRLKKKFCEINELLYTTSVPCDELERKVLPYIADDVIFKDPWQEGGDKQMYTIGMKGACVCLFTPLRQVQCATAL